MPPLTSACCKYGRVHAPHAHGVDVRGEGAARTVPLPSFPLCIAHEVSVCPRSWQRVWGLSRRSRLPVYVTPGRRAGLDGDGQLHSAHMQKTGLRQHFILVGLAHRSLLASQRHVGAERSRAHGSSSAARRGRAMDPEGPSLMVSQTLLMMGCVARNAYNVNQ